MIVIYRRQFALSSVLRHVVFQIHHSRESNRPHARRTHQNFDFALTSSSAHSFMRNTSGSGFPSVGTWRPTTWYWWYCASNVVVVSVRVARARDARANPNTRSVRVRRSLHRSRAPRSRRARTRECDFIFVHHVLARSRASSRSHTHPHRRHRSRRAETERAIASRASSPARVECPNE